MKTVARAWQAAMFALREAQDLRASGCDLETVRDLPQHARELIDIIEDEINERRAKTADPDVIQMAAAELRKRVEAVARAIRVWKGLLISLNSVNRADLDTLLHLYHMVRDSFGKHITFSGDTLLALAGLLRSGLVETHAASASFGGGGHAPYSAFQLQLTPRGTALVEASLSGDEQRYLEVLK